MKQKSKNQLIKQMMRETLQEAARAGRERRKTSRQAEMALLDATSTSSLRFHGQLVIESKETAIITATELSSHSKKEDLVYYTDGAVHLAENDKRPGSQRRKFTLAAAVAHKTPDADGWRQVSFSVPQDGKKYYTQAEMSGIAGALGMAMSYISRNDHGKGG